MVEDAGISAIYWFYGLGGYIGLIGKGLLVYIFEHT